MTMFTYCRVSTYDQSTEIQEDVLSAAYPGAVLRTENASATTMDRPVLQLLLDMVSEGDVLVVLRLDRLARSVRDLMGIVDLLTSKGVALKIHDQSIDTSNATGRAFLQMLGVFAELETGLRSERQMAGIRKAQAEGRMNGRPISADVDSIAADLASGLSLAKVAERNNCSKSTVQRVRRAEKLKS